MSRHLSERTLAVHRKVSEDNLPDRVEVFVPTFSKGEGGMVVQVLGDRLATYGCRMMLTTEAEEIIRADGLELNAKWVVVVPLDADVKIGYQLVVYGAGWRRTVEVIGIANPRTFATMRSVFARDVV